MKKLSFFHTPFLYAEDGTWTHTILLPQAPEACASANSATSANKHYYIRVYRISQDFFWKNCFNCMKNFLQFFWKKWLTFLFFFAIIRKSSREMTDMRKCRNWQTSKTKDLVLIASVWVQVPSSALEKEKRKPFNMEVSFFFIFWKSRCICCVKQKVTGRL